MSMITVDTSEVNRLIGDIGKIPGRALKDGEALVEDSAKSVRDGMREEASGHPTFPAFPSSITHELRYRMGGVDAEIGPDKSRRQGALGNLLYFGSSRSGPVLDLDSPWRRETPRMEKALGEMAAKLFEG